jgi:hypothetical protein
MESASEPTAEENIRTYGRGSKRTVEKTAGTIASKSVFFPKYC